MSPVNLLSGSIHGQLPGQCIILIKGHIIGGIGCPCCIKYIFIVINNPKITSKWQLIQLAVHQNLICQAFIGTQIYSVICDKLIKRLQNPLIYQGSIARNILDGDNIKVGSRTRQLSSQYSLVVRASQIHHLNLQIRILFFKLLD